MVRKNHSNKASDSIVLTGSKEDLKILLIKRKMTHKGLWAFPVGLLMRKRLILSNLNS